MQLIAVLKLHVSIFVYLVLAVSHNALVEKVLSLTQTVDPVQVRVPFSIIDHRFHAGP